MSFIIQTCSQVEHSKLRESENAVAHYHWGLRESNPTLLAIVRLGIIAALTGVFITHMLQYHEIDYYANEIECGHGSPRRFYLRFPEAQ